MPSGPPSRSTQHYLKRPPPTSAYPGSGSDASEVWLLRHRESHQRVLPAQDQPSCAKIRQLDLSSFFDEYYPNTNDGRRV